MKHVVKGALIFLALILQNTLASHIEILGAAPSFLLVIMVAFAINSDSVYESIIYSVICGALLDLFWGRVFGLYTVLMMYSGVAVYYADEYIYKRSVAKAAVMTFLASVVIESVFYAASFSMFGEGRFLYMFFRIIVPTGAYNAILQAIAYMGITKLVPEKKRSEAV